MKPGNIFMRWGAQLTFERPVRNLSLELLISELNQSTMEMTEHLDHSSDSPGNRRQLSHMVGIERWGQRRLRVALGEPFLSEEYDHYRPSVERSWDELKSEWMATRQATLALANDLSRLGDSPEFKVIHNMYGSLSIKAWLRYLDVHTSSEAKHIT